jgi:hypothetical protein
MAWSTGFGKKKVDEQKVLLNAAARQPGMLDILLFRAYEENDRKLIKVILRDYQNFLETYTLQILERNELISRVWTFRDLLLFSYMLSVAESAPPEVANLIFQEMKK